MSEFYPVKKEVSRGMLTVTNKIESNAAFAVLHGSGAGVYIPVNVAISAGATVGLTCLADYVENPNDYNRDRTPFMVVRLVVGEPVDETPQVPVEKPRMLPTEERILAYLAGGFATTREVCAALPDKASLSVSNRLNAMFAKRLLAKADVYSAPDQTRASFCLWAVNVQAFVEGVEDDA
jgi:hypothetical protein